MADDMHHPGHNHADPQPPVPVGGRPDPAGESLAKALKVSFRLLRLIMVAVVVLFLLTGLRSIDPDEVGLKKLFGRIESTVDEGLGYTWPFPVGDIQVIDTTEQELTIDDFWMHETAVDKTQPLSERSVMDKGLRPGWDGALLTGDRNLLHVRLKCIYMVHDPVAYAKNVNDPEEIVRSAVCAGAIHAAVWRTADGLLRAEQKQFANDVRRTAQDRLDALNTGISINRIELNQTTWPLRALPDYNMAQRAISNAQKARDAAAAEAVKILNASAGTNYKKLVGDPAGSAGTASVVSVAGGDYDLIGRYSRARKSGDPEKADMLLARIDEVLLSRNTGGQASKIIAEAKAYSTATIQQAKSRADRFRELLP